MPSTISQVPIIDIIIWLQNNVNYRNLGYASGYTVGKSDGYNSGYTQGQLTASSVNGTIIGTCTDATRGTASSFKTTDSAQNAVLVILDFGVGDAYTTVRSVSVSSGTVSTLFTNMQWYNTGSVTSGGAVMGYVKTNAVCSAYLLKNIPNGATVSFTVGSSSGESYGRYARLIKIN